MFKLNTTKLFKNFKQLDFQIIYLFFPTEYMSRALETPGRVFKIQSHQPKVVPWKSLQMQICVF